MSLDGLQDRDHELRVAANLGNDGIHWGYVDMFRHFEPWPGLAESESGNQVRLLADAEQRFNATEVDPTVHNAGGADHRFTKLTRSQRLIGWTGTENVRDSHHVRDIDPIGNNDRR